MLLLYCYPLEEIIPEKFTIVCPGCQKCLGKPSVVSFFWEINRTKPFAGPNCPFGGMILLYLGRLLFPGLWTKSEQNEGYLSKWISLRRGLLKHDLDDVNIPGSAEKKRGLNEEKRVGELHRLKHVTGNLTWSIRGFSGAIPPPNETWFNSYDALLQLSPPSYVSIFLLSDSN